MGRLQTCFGVWNNRLGRFQQGQAAYEASVTILQQVNSPIAVAFSLAQGAAWLAGRNPQRAVELQTEALRLAQTSDLIWPQALISQALGEAIFLCGHYAEAETKIITGYALAKQINWPRALLSGHKALGLLYLALGRYQQAEDHLREAVGLARRYQYKVVGVESMLGLAEALRLQDRLAEAEACLAESRQVATALGLGLLIALVTWEEGCLAEQGGEYAVAKARFTESLATLGSSSWWNHTLPTLGWALIGLNELAEAQAYFQKVATEAEAKGRQPVILETQVGLAYIALRQASVDSTTVGSVTKVFQHVYQQPATAQETRDRLTKLAAMLGISLHNTPLSPGFPLGFAASA